ADRRRLVVVDPVADIFDAGFGAKFGGLPRRGQAGSEPAHRALARESLDHAHCAPDHCLLVRLLVDGTLLIGMTHEFPAGVPGLLCDARIVLADPRIDGKRRRNTELFVEIETPP